MRTWSRHYATRREVTGSYPDEVIRFFNCPKFSTSIMAPVVDSVSNRNEYQDSSSGENGGRRVMLTT
jgi:hypothetical protein